MGSADLPLVLLLVAPSVAFGVTGLPPWWAVLLGLAGHAVLFLELDGRHAPTSARRRLSVADGSGVSLALMALAATSLEPARLAAGLPLLDFWSVIALCATAWPVAALAMRGLVWAGPRRAERLPAVLMYAATWGLAIAPELVLAEALGLLVVHPAVAVAVAVATVALLAAAVTTGRRARCAGHGAGPATAGVGERERVLDARRRAFVLRHETVGPLVGSVMAQSVFVLDQFSSVSPLVAACATASLLIVGVKVALLVREVVSLQGSREQALTDDLTGLGNRRALLSSLQTTAAGHGGALLLLDLDRFKEVNDGLGHLAGDDLLRAVGLRLRESLREVLGEDLGGRATLVRLGGDEFAAVLDRHGEAAAREVAERLSTAVAASFTVSGRVVHVTASIGVALVEVVAADGAAAAALDAVRRADTAMYAAKGRRHGVVVHTSALDLDTRARLQTAEELREALEHGQLLVHYQPQVDLRTGTVTGAEALVRWAHPTRGLLAPDAFLPLAEENGLMGAVTTAVLRDACTQAAAWRAGSRPLTVSVNLSANDLVPELVEEVGGILAAAGLPAAALVLEVTETTIVRDLARAAAVLLDIVDLGVTVSIDDYGTGWSSLRQLQAMPVGELKLDRSFTTGLGGGRAPVGGAPAGRPSSNEAIVRTTVDLAHALGLRLVAEGVEDQTTYEHLRRLGCDTSQGYLHSRPLPAEDFMRWLLVHEALVRVPAPRTYVQDVRR